MSDAVLGFFRQATSTIPGADLLLEASNSYVLEPAQSLTTTMLGSAPAEEQPADMASPQSPGEKENAVLLVQPPAPPTPVILDPALAREVELAAERAASGPTAEAVAAALSNSDGMSSEDKVDELRHLFPAKSSDQVRKALYAARDDLQFAITSLQS